MRSLLILWAGICLLRVGPQQLPASPHLLALSLVLYGVVDGIVSLMAVGPDRALAITALDITLMVALVTLLLQVAGHRERFLQTLTAMAGCGVLLSLAAMPLLAMIYGNPDSVPGDPVRAGIGLLWLGLLFWSLAIHAHILRHALSVPFGIGLVFSTLYAVTVFMMAEWLFPQGT